MPVPAQALKAEEAATALHQKVYGTPPEEGTPASPDVNGEAPDIKPEDLPTADDPNSDTWKHKFQVLQGKYNAEVKADVHQLNRQIHDLTERNKELEGQVNNLSGMATQNEELQNQLKTLQLQVEKAGTPDNPDGRTDTSQLGEDMLTAEEREHLEEQDLDGKTMAIIARISDRSVQKGMKTVDDRIGAIERKVEATEKKTAESSLNAYQKTIVEGVGGQDVFDHLNNHPKFVNEWLAETMPYSTETRHEVLKRNFKENRPQQVIQMFKDFQKWLGEDGKPKGNKKGERYTPPDKADMIEPTGDNVSGQGDYGDNMITQAKMNEAYVKARKDPRGYGQSAEFQNLEKRFFAQFNKKT
jgi:hypothetical protein